jgi:hypothetical protein
MQYVFLSHDVDWRRQGPPKEHQIERKDRFDPAYQSLAGTENLYYNLPEIMEIEEKFGIRSTFFFRTKYENGDFTDYKDDIRSLTNGGWEIGLHCDPTSVQDIEKIKKEKTTLEQIAKTTILGNRVHYLKFDTNLPAKLKKLGFEYDSSTRKTKDKIDQSEMGHTCLDGIIEFPVTIMDAYLFTHMGITEENILPTFETTLSYGRKLNQEFNVITVLWHDNVLKMKGGRMYGKIIEFLSSQNDVKICCGIDLAKIIKQKENC